MANFDEGLDKRLYEMNFSDDVGDDFYIDDMDEADEAAHRNDSNTPSDEAYRDMMAEEHTEKNGINNAAYNKYIGEELIMDARGERTRRETLRNIVEELDGAEVGTYHCNPLMDSQE